MTNNHSNSIQFKRKLSIERIYLARPMNYVVMNAVIQGHISKESLNFVLNRLLNKHQLLGAHIQIDNKGIAWFLVPKSNLDNSKSSEIEFEIQLFENLSKNEIEGLMAKEHTRFFNILNGPLIRFSLVNNKIKGIAITNMILCCHHSICDGISLTFLVKDILIGLGTNIFPNTPAKLPPLIDERYIPKRKIPFLTRVLLSFFNMLWKKKKIEFDGKDYRELHQEFWKKYGEPFIIFDSFTEEQTKQIIDKCKENQVTVHSALITALLMAQNFYQGTKDSYLKDFHMPIDIRNRLNIPAGEKLGFYAVSIILKHKINMKKTFWENTDKIHKQIRKWLSSNSIYRLYTIAFFNPTLLDSLYFQKLGLIQNKISNFILNVMGIHNKIAGVALTNLGKLNIPVSYGVYKLLKIYGPSVYTEILEKVVGTATIDNQLCIIFTSGRDLIDKRIAEREFAYAKNLLTNHV